MGGAPIPTAIAEGLPNISLCSGMIAPMKPNLYTNAVLTVIAGSLLWSCIQNQTHPPTVSAQGPQRVIIVGAQTSIPIPVNVFGGAKYNTLQVDKMNPLPVTVVTGE
jgi:hypothetical protein